MDAVQETIIDALQVFATAMDNLFPIACKVAYLILVIALATAVWNGKGGSPTQLIWKIAACCLIVSVMAVWGDWVKPGTGLFSDIGEGIADSINQKAGLLKFQTAANSALAQAKNEAGAFAIFESLKYGALVLLYWLANALRWLVKTVQYAVILFFYGIGPIFLATLSIQTTSPIGKKFLFTLAGFYLWDLILRLVEIITVGIMTFGGFTNYALFPIAAIFLIVGYIIAPILGTKLFTAGHTGISHMAGNAAMRFGSGPKAGGKVGGMAVGSTLKAAGAAVAAVATGGASKIASAGKIFSNLGSSTTKAAAQKTASTGTQGATTNSSGPVGVGDTVQAGKASIKRTSPNTFAMGGSEHNGDPNSPADLSRALNATTYSATEKSGIRMAMSSRNLKQEKNQQVAQEFPV